MGREWWAINDEDTWPGMVMDLRRLGFESVALEAEVLVREGAAVAYQAEGPAVPDGLKPFPAIHPTIQIRKESYMSEYSDLTYVDDDEEYEDDDELEPVDLDDNR